MATINLVVVSGGGGWTATGATYPTNQNDGDDATYQGWPGDTAGTNSNFYDYGSVPAGAVISNVAVSGNWGAGSAPATASFRFSDGTNSVTMGTINDVTSYSFNSNTAPDGSSWDITDIQNFRLNVVSLQTGNGNAMKLKSSVMTVTYVLSGDIFVSIY